MLGINTDEQKISLGVRQLEPNPWDEVETRYPVGSTIKGKIRNLNATELSALFAAVGL